MKHAQMISLAKKLSAMKSPAIFYFKDKTQISGILEPISYNENNQWDILQDNFSPRYNETENHVISFDGVDVDTVMELNTNIKLTLECVGKSPLGTTIINKPVTFFLCNTDTTTFFIGTIDNFEIKIPLSRGDRYYNPKNEDISLPENVLTSKSEIISAVSKWLDRLYA